MASKKKEVQLQTVIVSQVQWEEMLLNKGLTVVDVYQAWCGPCKAVLSLFRKLKNEYGEDNLLHFAVAEANSVVSLLPFKDKCEPAFIFCVNGNMIDIVRGANGPLLCKKVIEIVEQERKIVAGEMQRQELPELMFIEERVSDEEPEEEEAEEEEKYTVVIIKPDAVAEGKVEEIKLTITEAGFVILAEDLKMLSDEQVRDFYQNKSEEPEFEDFVSFMLSGPCHVLIVSEGKQAHEVMPYVTDSPTVTTRVDSSSHSAATAQALVLDKRVLDEMKWLLGPGTAATATLLGGHCELFQVFTMAPPQPPQEGRHCHSPRQCLCNVMACFTSLRADSSDKLRSRVATAQVLQVAIFQKGPAVEKTLALIRPSLLRERRESILMRIQDDGFEIAMQKEIILTEEQARMFYKEHEDQDYFPVLLEQMTSGPTLALALVRENAIQKWRGLLGPKIVEEAKQQCPTSLRAEYAIDSAPINQLHGSSTSEQAVKELEFFFPVQNTFAVIKPTAFEEHKDEIIHEVKEAGFIISEMKETQITPEMAAQFYKSQEGKPFYDQLVNYMSEGLSMVMILTKENAVEEWRQLMGPTDPEKAKETQPGSLRAKFARDIMRNAVHGSSNPEHAVQSIKFIFGDVDLEDLKHKYIYV
ncbi:thioredoxin domain-containing protein 3 [Rhineura floridana]|uniref:thioredoxin domain-containing protein 3 n=1 Tax=Rhineura floridana TaxID=261503 RepID=UPI002AC88E13|nr:thioredoxin domain-containing protein 3 [Rhineura floridana]